MIQWWLGFSPGLTSETEPKWSSLDFWTSRFERSWAGAVGHAMEMPWKLPSLYYGHVCLLRKMMIDIRNLACGKIADENSVFTQQIKWIVSWGGGSPVVWDSFWYALGWNHQILPRSMFLLKGKHANLTGYIHIYPDPYLSRPIHTYPYASISIHIYPYLSMSIHIHSYSLIPWSIYMFVYPYLYPTIYPAIPLVPAGELQFHALQDWPTGWQGVTGIVHQFLLSPRH